MWKIACRQSLLTVLVTAVGLGGLALSARAQSDLLVASQATDQVLRYDGATGAFLGAFVAAGSGGLDSTGGMALGPDGRLYVGIADQPSGAAVAGKILRFDAATGAFIDTFIQGFASGINGFAWGPGGVFYVASCNTNRVSRFDATTGALIDSIIGAGSPANCVTGVSFGPDGNLYVGSFNSDQVLRFNPTTGAFIDIFATVPSAPPGFPHPGVGGLNFGPDGNLYVDLPQGNDVVVFNGTTGALIGSFIPAADPHPLGPRVHRFGPDGNLYVTASTTDQVLRYDGTTGAFIDNFVSAGSGGLDGPFGFVFVSKVDSDGDGVDDWLDNCTTVSNPRVDVDFLVTHPWATLTGGQRDDDHDGFGNKCDAKFVGLETQVVGGLDLSQFRASSGNNRDVDECGTTGTLPCAIFDLDENTTTANTIGALDLSRFRALNGFLPGPKCPACPLACTAGASGTCF